MSDVIPLVDAHCHIDLYPSPEEVVKWAESNKVYTIAVTNAPSVFHHTANLVKHCKYVRPAIGLHPQLVYMKKHEISDMRELLNETRYVGEIGLDYGAKQEEDEHHQRLIFSSILDMCAENKDKILTVHSRHAASDVISAIGNKFDGKVILHWFSGTIKELERAISYGMYFSVNANMTSSKKGQDLIRRMPIERVITETDGPFIKISGKPSEPIDVTQAIKGLASIWKTEREEAREQVFNNFKQVLH